MIWRCADRVEKGKQSGCKYSATISDIAIKALICTKLEQIKFNEETVKQQVSQILISSSEQIDIVCRLNMNLQV